MFKETSKKIAEEIFLSFKKKQAEDPNTQKTFFKFVKEKVRRSDPKAIKMFLDFVEDLKSIKPNMFENKVPYEKLPENMKVKAWEEFLKILAEKFMSSQENKKYKIDLTKNTVSFEQIPEEKKNFKDKAWKIFWDSLDGSKYKNEIEEEIEKVLKNLKIISSKNPKQLTEDEMYKTIYKTFEIPISELKQSISNLKSKSTLSDTDSQAIDASLNIKITFDLKKELIDKNWGDKDIKKIQKELSWGYDGGPGKQYNNNTVNFELKNKDTYKVTINSNFGYDI